MITEPIWQIWQRGCLTFVWSWVWFSAGSNYDRLISITQIESYVVAINSSVYIVGCRGVPQLGGLVPVLWWKLLFGDFLGLKFKLNLFFFSTLLLDYNILLGITLLFIMYHHPCTNAMHNPACPSSQTQI